MSFLMAKLELLRRDLGFASTELHVPQLQGKIIKLKCVTDSLTCTTPAHATDLLIIALI